MPGDEDGALGIAGSRGSSTARHDPGDAAVVGDSLLGQLSTIQAIPKFLVPLAFLGVASFMTGIALEFASIPGILDRRIAVLKQAVPLMGGK